MANGLRRGYATASNDTGHKGGSAAFAVGHPEKLIDFAYRAMHEMTVQSKAIIQSFYRRSPQLSYYQGCSTGGRQALMEVQKYPQDYNGVVAASPAINWTKLHAQQLWGPVLMNSMNNPVAPCKLAAATAAAVAACDSIDGVKDGVLEDPKRCTYDPKALVGTSAGECGMFTDGDATGLGGHATRQRTSVIRIRQPSRA